MRIYVLLAMAASASFIGSNCGGSGVGDPCIPEDEYVQGFAGFNESEVGVESRSFQCLTRVCLVNHFRGRVSCPYGQVSENDLDGEMKANGHAACGNSGTLKDSKECLPGGANHPTSCRVPDRDGSEKEALRNADGSVQKDAINQPVLGYVGRIDVSVSAQLRDRAAASAVYCSCRCKGDDKAARYCECPSGFSCSKLVDDTGLGDPQLAGSYCIKAKTEYQPSTTLCDPVANTCGSVDKNKHGLNPPNAAIVD